MHRLSLFIAGVLVFVSAGISVFFYSRSREDARRIEHDARRIRELENQLALARAEISDYQGKLREAEQIADDFERERDAKERLALEYAARIETLEARLEPPVEPEPVAAPTRVALVEGDAFEAEAEPFVPGPAKPAPPIEPDGPEVGETPTVERAEAEAPRRTLERELEEVRTEKRDLEIKYAALVGEKAEGVPLGTVNVTTGLQLKGKVLVVNQRHSFVVIDLGARDGVEKGMVLVLHRGRKFLGKCQVEKVYTRMAAADLMLDWMQDEVAVNDGVRKF